jgi:hypothetical protein
MGLIDAMAELRRGWPELPALLPPAPARAVHDLADQLVTESDPDGRRRLRFRMLRVLDGALARDHPIRAALLRGDDRRSPGTGEQLDRELTELRLLAPEIEAALEADPDSVLATAQADLLATPGLSPAELRAGGGDPDRRDLVRLRSSAGESLPRFQFDRTYRPYRVVLVVNRILGADADPWGVASWWLRANGWLDAVPAELVGRGRDDALIEAGRAELGED